MSDNLTLWYKAARGYTLSLSVIPYLLGTILASINYELNLKNSVLGLIGVLLVHASFNLLDDYNDWTSGKVEQDENKDNQKNSRSHKAFYLKEKLISQKELLFSIIFCQITGLFIGIFLAYTTGFIILQLAAIGALFAIGYTLPPLDLNTRGLGELAIGIIFGPLIVTGSYVVAGGGNYDSLCILSSIIIGILIANTAHTHSILDYEKDLKNNKRTLSVCLLSKNKAIYIQLLLYIWAFLFLFLGIVYGIYPKETFLCLFILPLAVELNSLMFNDEIEPKLWYGPISQMKNYNDNYFMLRLCLARNIVTFFALFLSIICYLYG